MAAVPMETFKLVEPVEIELRAAGGEARVETIGELTLYKFKAKDLRALDGLPDDAKGSQLLALIARMTRQPVKVIDELGAEDMQTLGDKVGGFLPNGLKTGQTG
jgi:hypothetical protein